MTRKGTFGWIRVNAETAELVRAACLIASEVFAIPNTTVHGVKFLWESIAPHIDDVAYKMETSHTLDPVVEFKVRTFGAYIDAIRAKALQTGAKHADVIKVVCEAYVRASSEMSLRGKGVYRSLDVHVTQDASLVVRKSRDRILSVGVMSLAKRSRNVGARMKELFVRLGINDHFHQGVYCVPVKHMSGSGVDRCYGLLERRRGTWVFVVSNIEGQSGDNRNMKRGLVVPLMSIVERVQWDEVAIVSSGYEELPTKKERTLGAVMSGAEITYVANQVVP